MATALPVVSVVIPCRNEARFIAACLESLVANDYPRECLEVVVVDGMSEDGSREIVAGYVRRFPFIRLLDNPDRITSAALNRGIRSSSGSVVFWMGAHSQYAPNYIRESVWHLRNSDADNVGGIMITVARSPGWLAEAIVAALSSPFGVGNSVFRTHARTRRWVDTVFGGAFRREVFDQVGLFNEGLVRGQDLEFNLRLRRAGKRTLFVPEIVAYYSARTDLGGFWRHNWVNGQWAVLPFLYSSIVPVAVRHLVPLAFVSALTVSLLAGIVWRPAWWLLALVVGLYAVASVAAAVSAAIRRSDWRLVVTLPIVFTILHVSYGLGGLQGIMQLIWRRVRGERRPASSMLQ